nr:hypothetical protein [Tanacetum cinerariifolium]
MMGNRALLTNFVEKFLGTVRFGNNDFAIIAGYGDVIIGSMMINRVYYVEGLDLLTGNRSSNLYTIALNEIASNSSDYILAKASSLQSWLWHQRLSHLNFATINNLVKNNLVRGLPKMKFEKDHLCFACKQGKIHRKHHKSKTAFASNQPLYLLHMDLCGLMRIESINGKRYVLVVVDDFHGTYGYSFFVQKMKLLKTPQQNGVVEKRNRTLVEGARTMLTFANLPLFLWAEAIATSCFTHNRSMIHKHFDKTPYELINKRKPNIKFFHVFGCRCYLFSDYDNVGKLKAKGDIEVFVGYSKDSVAFRVYNKGTHKIHKNVNVNFDEISEMASKQFSLEPDLFHNFYDEYFDASKLKKSLTTNVETSNNEGEVFHKVSESFQGNSSSSSLNDDVQESPEKPYPHEQKRTKDHPYHKTIGDPKSSVHTRGQLSNSCLFACLLSSIEPANVAEALKNVDWVIAMQDELDQFSRLKV